MTTSIARRLASLAALSTLCLSGLALAQATVSTRRSGVRGIVILLKVFIGTLAEVLLNRARNPRLRARRLCRQNQISACAP